MAAIVDIDARTRVIPVLSVREAKQHGHQAACSRHTVLGVLSACDGTPRVLDATHEAFQIMIGAW